MAQQHGSLAKDFVGSSENAGLDQKKSAEGTITAAQWLAALKEDSAMDGLAARAVHRALSSSSGTKALAEMDAWCLDQCGVTTSKFFHNKLVSFVANRQLCAREIHEASDAIKEVLSIYMDCFIITFRESNNGNILFELLEGILWFPGDIQMNNIHGLRGGEDTLVYYFRTIIGGVLTSIQSHNVSEVLSIGEQECISELILKWISAVKSIGECEADICAVVAAWAQIFCSLVSNPSDSKMLSGWHMDSMVAMIRYGPSNNRDILLRMIKSSGASFDSILAYMIGDSAGVQNLFGIDHWTTHQLLINVREPRNLHELGRVLAEETRIDSIGPWPILKSVMLFVDSYDDNDGVAKERLIMLIRAMHLGSLSALPPFCFTHELHKRIRALDKHIDLLILYLWFEFVLLQRQRETVPRAIEVYNRMIIDIMNWTRRSFPNSIVCRKVTPSHDVLLDISERLERCTEKGVDWTHSVADPIVQREPSEWRWLNGSNLRRGYPPDALLLKIQESTSHDILHKVQWVWSRELVLTHWALSRSGQKQTHYVGVGLLSRDILIRLFMEFLEPYVDPWQ